MSSVEIVFTWVSMAFRFIMFIGMLIFPFVLAVKLIGSIRMHDFKKAIYACLGLGFLGLLIYLSFFTQTVSAKVNIKDFENYKKQVLQLDDGLYKFDTGYICGRLFVDNALGYNDDELSKYKLYKLDNETTCYVSDVVCVKDSRWYYLFYPTLASGEIIVKSEQKYIYIDYYYCDYNFSTIFWFVTNPEVIYRKTIQIDDIISNIETTRQLGEQSGENNQGTAEESNK